MLEWGFLALMLLYFGLLIAVAIFSKGTGSKTDFFLASRKLTGRSVGASLGATTVGGSAVLATAAATYTFGLPGIWYDLAGGIGLIILGLLIAPKIRKMAAHSLPDLIGISYGGEGKFASAIMLVLTEIGWIALLIQASGFVISTSLTVSLELATGIAASVFIVYTAIGGQKAVVKTDVIQMVFILLMFVVLSLSLFIKGGRLSTDSIEFPISDGFGLSTLLAVFSIMFLSHVVGPDIYSKVFSARSPRDARIGSVLAGFIKILVGLLIGTIVLMSISIFGGDLRAGELIPYAAENSLPPVLFYLITLGLLSVMMSSADSCLLSGSTFLSWDLMGGKCGKISRILSVVLLGSISYLVASVSPGILSTLTLTYTFFSASMIPAVAFSPWRRKLGINRVGAIFSFVTGGLAVCILYVLSLFDHFGGELLFIPLTISTTTLFMVSWMSVPIKNILSNGAITN